MDRRKETVVQCSPRHRMQFNSRREGLRCALDDMASTIRQCLAQERRRRRVCAGHLIPGAYTRPLFRINVITFDALRPVGRRQKRLRLS